MIGVGSPQEMVTIAGPAAMGRVIDHGSARGVEFYVALAGQQTSFVLE